MTEISSMHASAHTQRKSKVGRALKRTAAAVVGILALAACRAPSAGLDDGATRTRARADEIETKGATAGQATTTQGGTNRVTGAQGMSGQPTATLTLDDATREFLALAFPLPSTQLVIVYEIEGKVGLGGTLEIVMAAGGYRRENWTLTSDFEEGSSQFRLTVIRRPDLLWSGLEGEPGVAVALPFAALAASYRARPQEQRDSIVAAMQAHAKVLTDARAKSPGDRREVAGVSCLSVRAAAQNLCLWEEAGVALDYQGASLRIQAVSVALGPALSESAFEPPTGANFVATAPQGVGTVTLDAEAWLERMADGHYEAMLELGQPGFEVPDRAQDWVSGAAATP